jgi:hypothetical protein
MPRRLVAASCGLDHDGGGPLAVLGRDVDGVSVLVNGEDLPGLVEMSDVFTDLEVLVAHVNARLTVHGRRVLVERVVRDGRQVAHVAKELGISRQCEAQAAYDADRLDCLFQALQYQAAGATELDSWVDSSLSNLRTDTARSIGPEVPTMPPGEWHHIAQAGDRRNA